jgi:RNA polymerase sigma-70 factor (ECF subfamily)
MELLLVAGKSNKEVAELLGITEQQVANYKSDFIERTRSLLGRLPLDAEVFPELHSP